MHSEFIKNVAAFINSKSGIHINFLSTKELDRNIRERMALCKISNPEIYFKLLTSSPSELQEFLELVIVPETWFFREKGSFDFFKDYVEKKFLFSPKKKLKILSMPCSSGEEPYSIAMILSDLGMSTKNFSIHAADISQKALVKAEYGIYTKNSFRGDAMGFREKYFTHSKETFTFEEKMRHHVDFFQENAKEPKVILKNKYDVIFCRNFFIYLDPESQKTVIKTLDHILDEDGVIIVGHSEGMVFQKSGYEYVRLNSMHASAYCKKEKVLKKSAASHKKTTQAQLLQEAKDVDPGSSEKVRADLDKAQDLANKGQLEEAKEICTFYLKRKPTAQVYYLMGVILHAQDHLTLALEYFQKALILEPLCKESLFYLRLLVESLRK